MTSLEKKGSFSLYRFAKQVQGLHKQEKAILVDIADAAGQVDGYCSKSIPNMADQHAHNERGLRYGLYGRVRKNTKGDIDEVFPGIVKRGLVYSVGPTSGGLKPDGKGITIVWRVNVTVLLTFLPECYQHKLSKILNAKGEPNPAPSPEPKGEPNPAQPGQNGAGNFPTKHFLKKIPDITSQSTSQPNSQTETGKEGGEECDSSLDSTSKSKPKGSGQGEAKGKFKKETLLAACRQEWKDYVDWFKEEERIDKTDHPDTYPCAALNYQGIQTLMDALENGDWSVEDVQEAFGVFLRDKYHRDFDKARIDYPLSLFAENLYAYLKPMEAEASDAR